MGVFPLAGTMNFISNPPPSRGDTPHAPVYGRADEDWSHEGWSDEVWWQPDPTTIPRRTAAAAHSPIHHIDHSHTSSRATSAGEYIR